MKKIFFILLALYAKQFLAQKEVLLPPDKPAYDRKEEIIFDGKRYRIHNNYLTFGIGLLQSNIRNQSQKTAGVDFQFHLKKQHFQAGAMMSGDDLFGNNNTQFHCGYGYRREKNTSNVAIYAGPTYFTGVEGAAGAPASFYDGFGVYLSAQAIYKVKYDIGLGLEFFGDVSYKQVMSGLKIIVFFSGSYRGLKKNYNPNVRSESGK
jgi:hypothetical protein